MDRNNAVLIIFGALEILISIVTKFLLAEEGSIVEIQLAATITKIIEVHYLLHFENVS